MPKGTPCTIAGSIYPRPPKPKSNKRKARGQPSGPRRPAKIGGMPMGPVMTGSGDYNLGPYSYKGDTPYARVGRKLGKAAGLFGLPSWVADAGEALGHGVGRLFGSGDYTTGPMVRSNCLTNSTDVPMFSGNGRGTIITHREYVNDITTSSVIGAFKNQSFTIQPGNAITFPWLSSIAEHYEQYRIHGMVFYFKSTSGDSVGSTNTAIGTVVLSTDYNVNSTAYTTKQQMENAEFAQSAKASANQVHGIECDVAERSVALYFVRSDSINATDSLKWYDFANFQIATQGFQAANVNVGELWVSYTIEFFKPQVATTIGGTVQGLAIERTGITNALPLGTGTNYGRGDLPFSITNTALTLSGLQDGTLLFFNVTWIGSVAAVIVDPIITFTNATLNTVFYGVATGVPVPGTSTARYMQFLSIRVNNASLGVVTMTVGAAGTLPTGTVVCNILVTQIDSSLLG